MEIFVIFCLILLNGVFAMSEIAMVSAKKSRLEYDAKKGDKGARKALELSSNPGKFLSTVQIGITLIGILTGIYSGDKIHGQLVAFIQRNDLLYSYSNLIATVVILVLLTFFSLVLGELVPKRVGLAIPEKVSKILAFPMYVIAICNAPFIWLLTKTSDGIINLLGIKASPNSVVTEEEIKSILREGADGGSVQQIEREIVERVFNLGDRKIGSLMTHKNDVVSLKLNFTAQEISQTINSEMHSVYPVLNQSMELAGIISLKSVFKHINESDFDMSQHMVIPQYVYENYSAYDVLKTFKMQQVHQAIVIDEFGEMQGLVTLNDLLEALVGDVSDFYGGEFVFQEREDGTWLIDGQFPLSDFLYKFDMQELMPSLTINTIGGLIIYELKKIPSTGEILFWGSFKFEIMDMDSARIDKVLVTRIAE